MKKTLNDIFSCSQIKEEKKKRDKGILSACSAWYFLLIAPNLLTNGLEKQKKLKKKNKIT